MLTAQQKQLVRNLASINGTSTRVAIRVVKNRIARANKSVKFYGNVARAQQYIGIIE